MIELFFFFLLSNLLLLSMINRGYQLLKKWNSLYRLDPFCCYLPEWQWRIICYPSGALSIFYMWREMLSVWDKDFVSWQVLIIRKDQTVLSSDGWLTHVKENGISFIMLIIVLLLRFSWFFECNVFRKCALVFQLLKLSRVARFMPCSTDCTYFIQVF